MEKYLWPSICKGDWVRLKHNESDGYVEGTVGSVNLGCVIIAGATLAQKHYSVVGYKAGYKDGDIGIHKNLYGDEFVGIYNSKQGAFYANRANTSDQPQFRRGDVEITIIGNINDKEEGSDEWI